MKILIVGAGALGGYFGGRLLQAGRDVTFLVRENRAKQLASTGGLVIRSPLGDATIANPPLMMADQITTHYDVVIVCCKGYALDECMESIAPAVGPDTLLLPVLNGMRHLDKLIERFGGNHVLGGRCTIFADMDSHGRIIHENDIQIFSFGELDGTITPRVSQVEEALSGAGFKAILCQDIMQEMWEKWVMIVSMAGTNCLMRAPVCDVVAAEAERVALAINRECSLIAALNGHAPRAEAAEMARKFLTNPKLAQAASMLKDVEKGRRTEVEHVVGDLLARVPGDYRQFFPVLAIVYSHLRTYEARRQRGVQPVQMVVA